MLQKFVIHFLICAFMLTTPLLSVVRILTFHCNKPDFLELQCKTFKKFMRDDYELIVFNDAKTPELEQAIQKTCEKYGARCISYDQQRHEIDPLNAQVVEWMKNPTLNNPYSSHFADYASLEQVPGLRHCHLIQYALDNFGYNHNDIVAIADGDLFPIKPVSIRSLLGNCHIAGIQRIIPQDNVEYLWVPFIAMDMRTIPHKEDLKFHLDVINNKLHDVGSHSYHYLKNHPEVRAKRYPIRYSTTFRALSPSKIRQQGFSKREMRLIKRLPQPMSVEFHFEGHLLHFGASSYEDQPEKAKIVKGFLKELLAR